MMNATAAVLEPKLAGGAIAYIAAFGQCGSALFPWVTGALASKFGVWSLQRESPSSLSKPFLHGPQILTWKTWLISHVGRSDHL